MSATRSEPVLCATCGHHAIEVKGIVYLEALPEDADWPCQPDDEILLHVHDRSLADWVLRGGKMEWDDMYLGSCRVGATPRNIYPPCKRCHEHVGVSGAFATTDHPNGFIHMSHSDDGTWADEMCKRDLIPGPAPIWIERRSGDDQRKQRRRC